MMRPYGESFWERKWRMNHGHRWPKGRRAWTKVKRAQRKTARQDTARDLAVALEEHRRVP